jgi:hypothetical protein
MKKFFLVMFAAIMFAGLFSSCQKYPQAELDLVSTALLEVKDLGADVYVPELYNVLLDSVTSVNFIAETERSKVFSNYDEVKTMLIVVDSLLLDVKVKNEERKLVLESENSALLEEVKSLVEENKKLASRAPRGKEGRSALALINDEILLVESTVLEVDTVSNLLQLNEKLNLAKAKSLSLKDELVKAVR